MKTLALLLALLLHAPGAVVATNYGPSGLLIPLTTTGSYGAFLFQLSPESAVPEFVFTFYADQLIISRAEYGNKNSKIVGWDTTAARLTVGDMVSYLNYPREAELEWDWKPGVTGYLGLLINYADDGDPANYNAGYLHLKWNPDTSITLIDSAYETQAGKSIVVPEPNFFLFTFACPLLLKRTRTKI